MSEAGVDTAAAAGETDDFEMAKSAAFAEGVEEAIAHVMGSEIVKTAGVTEDDLMNYELGLAKGQGYAETRMALEAIVEKIAAEKTAAKKMPTGLLSKIRSGVVGMRDDVAEHAANRLSKAAPATFASSKKGAESAGKWGRRAANVALGGAAAGAVAAPAAAGYMAGKKSKK
jgi:hypothetical protein